MLQALLRRLPGWHLVPRSLAGPIATLVASVTILTLLAGCGSTAPGPRTARACIYSGDRVNAIGPLERLTGTHITCALIFDTDQPTWTDWDHPWFTTNPIAAENWVAFARRPGDRLVITVPLIPAQALSQNWRTLGAAGAYSLYDRILARNLVASGMGHATIRLAHEANGTWTPDNVGKTPRQFAEWKRFWQRTVIAMRSVRGADFSFDWCIAGGYRAIPFSDYYPGDRYVNSIGVDVYDMGEPADLTTGASRFDFQLHRPGGLAAIAAFARRVHRPLTVPEWGLEPKSIGGGGDDVTFVRDLSRYMRANHVTMQSYFFSGGSLAVMAEAPQIRVAYSRLLRSD